MNRNSVSEAPEFIYAIREKETLKYLPKVKNSFSYSEPELYGGGCGPRWFNSHRSAQNALIAWARGQWEMNRGMMPKVRLGTARDRDRFEIVRFSISEHGSTGI